MKRIVRMIKISSVRFGVGIKFAKILILGVLKTRKFE